MWCQDMSIIEPPKLSKEPEGQRLPFGSGLIIPILVDTEKRKGKKGKLGIFSVSIYGWAFRGCDGLCFVAGAGGSLGLWWLVVTGVWGFLRST
jgi:hypothetical protein